MAEINWNHNLEVSKMKGDRREYRKGGSMPVEGKKKKKIVTITKKPKGREGGTKTPTPHKSRGKLGKPKKEESK